ncbi:MAG: ABC transporter permease [Candidatus Eisenbacteria bacterium]|nr:ABC transporter permease [Candidatus Eisenbacteria bacterium]
MYQLWWSNLLVGADALRIHPLRTLLSVLGILIGSAALVATMAVSDGLMVFVRDRVQRELSVQVVTLSPRLSRFEDGEWVPQHDYPIFTDADAEALLRHAPGVQSATLVLGGRAEISHRGVRRHASVTFGTASLPEFGQMEIGAGHFFSAAEAEHNLPVVVINYALARELLPSGDPLAMVGREIRVERRTRRVVGVLAATGFENREDPSLAALAPLRSARAILAPQQGRRLAPTIRLLARSLESVDAVEEDATDWLARRWPDWPRRVTLSVGREQLQQVEQAFLLLKLFVGALVGISLLVGGIGIMNVLLAAVAERTREIGIRKSVGARRADIMAQFLTESVVIALAGAAAGLVLGLVIAAGVTALFRGWVGAPVYPVLSWTSVLVATLSSSAVGLVFGTYPARRAANLSPVAAIAHE